MASTSTGSGSTAPVTSSTATTRSPPRSTPQGSDMTDQLEVDVTGWVIARLTGVMVARVGSKLPADLASELPFIRVVRVGGPDDGYAIDFPTVVFHCFAATEAEANTLGYGVAAAL